jgi:actin-related protein
VGLEPLLTCASLVWQDIFLTGGNCAIPGFTERVEAEIRSLRPYESELCVRVASNAKLDAWRGAAAWSRLYADEYAAAAVSKAEYDESGASFFKSHRWSNVYMRKPQSDS